MIYQIILIVLAGFYAWQKNLFNIRYKKDISATDTTQEVEEYLRHTTPQEREDAVEQYQESMREEQVRAEERVIEDSYPIEEVLNILGMQPNIYPDYPKRVSKHLLDTSTKQSILKRHLISLQPTPLTSSAESSYNNVTRVPSTEPKFRVGHKIIYTKHDWKWGRIWKIDYQKYYLENYTGSGFTGTDTPFPGKWVIYRQDEKYMRRA